MQLRLLLAAVLAWSVSLLPSGAQAQSQDDGRSYRQYYGSKGAGSPHLQGGVNLIQKYPHEVRKSGERADYTDSKGHPGRWINELSPCKCASTLLGWEVPRGDKSSAEERWNDLFPTASQTGAGGLLQTHKAQAEQMRQLLDESERTRDIERQDAIAKQIKALEKEIAATQKAISAHLQKRCIANDSGPEHRMFSDKPPGWDGVRLAEEVARYYIEDKLLPKPTLHGKAQRYDRYGNPVADANKQELPGRFHSYAGSNNGNAVADGKKQLPGRLHSYADGNDGNPIHGNHQSPPPFHGYAQQDQSAGSDGSKPGHQQSPLKGSTHQDQQNPLKGNTHQDQQNGFGGWREQVFRDGRVITEPAQEFELPASNTKLNPNTPQQQPISGGLGLNQPIAPDNTPPDSKTPTIPAAVDKNWSPTFNPVPPIVDPTKGAGIFTPGVTRDFYPRPCKIVTVTWDDWVSRFHNFIFDGMETESKRWPPGTKVEISLILKNDGTYEQLRGQAKSTVGEGAAEAVKRIVERNLNKHKSDMQFPLADYRERHQRELKMSFPYRFVWERRTGLRASEKTAGLQIPPETVLLQPDEVVPAGVRFTECPCPGQQQINLPPRTVPSQPIPQVQPSPVTPVQPSQDEQPDGFHPHKFNVDPSQGFNPRRFQSQPKPTKLQQ